VIGTDVKHHQTNIHILSYDLFYILYFRLTSQVMVENLSITDGQEGIKSFIEKRKPVWSHNTKKVH
jgi:hypothetical protein